MPTLTPKLGIRKPLGNETVNRAAFNENWDIIDAGAQRNITQNPTAPLSPSANDLWLDTSITPHTLRRWTGTAWAVVGALASDLTTHTALTNTAHGAVSAPTINTLMARNAAGRAQVADGVAASDIATTAQVNNLRTLIRMGAI